MTKPSHGRAFDAETDEEIGLLCYYARSTHYVERYVLKNGGSVCRGGFYLKNKDFRRVKADMKLIAETRRLRLEFADGRVVE